MVEKCTYNEDLNGIKEVAGHANGSLLLLYRVMDSHKDGSRDGCGLSMEEVVISPGALCLTPESSNGSYGVTYSEISRYHALTEHKHTGNMVSLHNV